jgi:hypothetical protein
VYADFAEKVMALPVLRGRKTDKEKFAGALRTYAIEAMMQDGRALQAGTSHNLGQNFAKAFEMEVDAREEHSPGWRFNEWELRGVPLRIEIGPKDIAKDQVVLARRDTGEKFAMHRKSSSQSACHCFWMRSRRISLSAPSDSATRTHLSWTTTRSSKNLWRARAAVPGLCQGVLVRGTRVRSPD